MMISLSLAKQLRDQGLDWVPSTHDFFAIPDCGLDDWVFVLSDILSGVEKISGRPVVSFHGTAEWATDYLLTTDAVWLPSEAQLRHLIFEILSEWGTEDITISLNSFRGGHKCEMKANGDISTFEASSAADSYALALLKIMQARPTRKIE
jgi:hypothetical protein